MTRCLALSLVLSLSLLAAQPSQASPNTAAKVSLTRVMPEIKFTNTPMRTAFEFLRDVSGANIHVNWRALEAAGVSPETTINVRLRAVPLTKVLELLLSESGAREALTYYVDEGVIEVTTKQLSDQQMITKVYPVEDLLHDMPDFVTTTNFDLPSSTARNSGRGGRDSWRGGSDWDTSRTRTGDTRVGAGAADSTANAGKSRGQRGEDLVLLITELVEPTIWRQNGGPASIKFFNGSLIVTAPRSVHEMIGGPID